MTDILTLTLKSNNKTLILGDDTKYRLISLEGIEASDITLNLQKNAQFDGSQMIGYRVEPRVITIEADYPAEDSTEDVRHMLEDFFVVQHPGDLTVNYMGTIRHIAYYVTSFKDKRQTLLEPLTFSVELTCPNPYFIGDEFSDNIAGKVPMLLTPFSIFKGANLTLAYRKYNNELTVVNPGAVSTGLEIEFIATNVVKNPRIDNLTTGEFLRVIVDMKAGDHLIVTTEHGNKRIELNGVNISQKKDRTSTFFQILEGENTLSYTADDGYTNLEVYPRWSAKYLGV
jgi:archaellum component FlaG (FlaF/FlaG flagellin family)